MMEYSKHKAWQFIHPDFSSQPNAGNGIQTQPNGKLAMVSNQDSIRQSILLLISTIPGERVMRPKYGCDIYQLAFMPNDATTHGLAIHYVRTALEQWEPRINIIHLDADVSSDDMNIIEINLLYQIRHSHLQEQLIFAYHLMGEQQ